jgi:hypothetical protein
MGMAGGATTLLVGILHLAVPRRSRSGDVTRGALQCKVGPKANIAISSVAYAAA